MRKQCVNKVTRVSLILFFIGSSLYGMDKDYDFVIKQAIIPNVDHKTQRIFAVLNKTYNKIIEDNYRPNKKRIELFMQEEAKFPCRRLWNKGFSRQGSCSQDFSRQISWNKDFSMCAWLNVKSTGHGRKSWGLTLLSLDDKDIIVEKNTKMSHGFYFPAIEGNIRPFFNKQGAACFQGYADVQLQVYGAGITESVVELSIDLAGNVQCQRCFFECYDSSKEDFYYILNFPVLVQALLRSTQVRNYDMMRGRDNVKLYHLNGVTLPEDYKTFKKHLGLEDNPDASYDKMRGMWRDNDFYSSYDTLPHSLKKDINDRYAGQEFDKMMVDIE